MAIYDFDKSEKHSNLQDDDNRPDQYKLNPQHSVYDHNNPDIKLAEELALENIRIAGAWVTVIPKSDDNKFNKIWMEDVDPTFYNGFELKAVFPPLPPEIILTKFGLDAPIRFDITFSRAEVLNVIGERMIQMGDIIVVPHNSLVTNTRRFQVQHVAEDGNYKYRWLYLKVSLENINMDESNKEVGDGI